MLAITALVTAAVLGVTLFWVVNRKTANRFAEARKALKARASSLTPYPVEDFLSSCKLLEENRDAGRMLISFLANLLDVSPENLACNYPMRDLFVVTIEESREEAAKDIEPFSYDLVERLAGLSEKSQWEKRWHEMPGLPRNQDGLADFITSMTVCEFLRFFSPLMAGKQIKGSSPE